MELVMSEKISTAFALSLASGIIFGYFSQTFRLHPWVG
jgi:hypothetical protein